MKGEILFRGKRKDNGEWVYGGIYVYNETFSIINDSLPVNPLRAVCNGIQVNPDTVGQFMGLTDKNGNKIFEGDIMQKWELDYETWKNNNYEGEDPLIATKIDVATMKRFPVFWLKNEEFGYEGDDLEDNNHWEIIGNIHDNPELITKK